MMKKVISEIKWAALIIAVFGGMGDIKERYGWGIAVQSTIICVSTILIAAALYELVKSRKRVD